MRRPCWSYGKNNNWEGLCSSGREQSPINIVDATPMPIAPPMSIAPIVFNYRSSVVSVENDSHTLRVNATTGNSLIFKGKHYELTQFHFHYHSEHLVAGESFPLELHLVHADDVGKTVVVGVFFQLGTANDALAPVWAKIPMLATANLATDNEAQMLEQQINLRLLLPDDFSAWLYQGSLTTPPCTEGVEWIILTKAMRLSAAQLQLFTHHYPSNCRPVQALGKRTVYYLGG